MKPFRTLPAIPTLAALTLLGLRPAAAQTPLFNDGTALGGSQVFSEGFNPLGNCARFDQPKPQPAWAFTYVTGDQLMLNHAPGMKSIVEAAHDPANHASDAQISAGILKLADSPWALRTRSYGTAFLADGVNGSYSHEEFNSVLASADTQAAHLIPGGVLHPDGAANPGNGTTVDIRRSVVERATAGSVSRSQGMVAGFNVRLERWKSGSRIAAINPDPALPQMALIAGGDPFEYRETALQTTTLAVDFGFTYEMFEGFRLAGTVNRLNAKRLWDVEEKPQGRAGVQIDIGPMGLLTVEADVNEAMRMPFPVKQRTTAASLRFVASRSITLLLGGERKRIGEATVTRGGATVQINLPGYCLAFGMQYNQDQPLKAFTAVFN